MFVVTKAAGMRLSQKLAEKQAGHDVVMRFVRKPGGWKLSLDTPGPNDVAVAHEGRTVLVLDPQAAQRLADSTLDAHDTPAGSRLRLR